jgi:hypothetical protein
MPAAPTIHHMLADAVSKGNTELANRLMDLIERAESRAARREYDTAFAAAKAEIGVVEKTGKANYGAYATLADIARALNEVLGKYGLGYRFRSQRVDRELIMTCVVFHSMGHSEENSLPGPLDVSGSKNPIQAIGSTSTYLQRYCLIQAFGLSAEVAASEIQDDDGDAAGVTKDGWPKGSIHRDGDYAGNGTRERDTKPKQDNKYTRTINAAVTHADRARAMQDELRQCTRVPELDALADEIKKRQDYMNLPDTLKDYVWKTQAKCHDRLTSEVVWEDTPQSISERAIAARNGEQVQGRPSRRNAEPPDPSTKAQDEAPDEIAEMLESHRN